MNKTAIKNFAISARKKLISMAQDRAGLIGITSQQIAAAAESGSGFAVYPTHFGTQTMITGRDLESRAQLVRQIQERGYVAVMEEVAYTWFNRLIAVRFMEVNNYLPTGVRVLSSEREGKQEPDLVTEAPKVDLNFTDKEVEEIYALKDDSRKSGELFKKLFIKQCNALGEILPKLFEETADYTELLLDIAWDKEDGVVRELLTINEADFLEAVEIIGWMYQYYNTEPKQSVFDGLKKNVKITKENIPAATQLFTPDWIVRYMVENSLGRFWVEHLRDDEESFHPGNGPYRDIEEHEPAIAALKENWKYYLEEAEQTDEVNERLALCRPSGDLTPEDIKLIDPCMGSGHILVYAFEVLVQLYVSCGYSERDAAGLILEKNLYGLDIDKRAYQLSYFALMMKARGCDRRFFTRGVEPQVYCPVGYPDGEEYGSLLLVDELEPKPEQPEEFTMFDTEQQYQAALNTWNFRRLLAQQYDVVVTNPPYMGASNGSAKLNDYIKKNFPDSKADLFACFIERCQRMTKSDAYTAMITQHSWMFLSSFEKLRAKLLLTDTVNMAHLGARAFEEIGGEVVQTTAWVQRKCHVADYQGTYARLVDYGSQQEKENAFLACQDLHTAQQENFSKIPGSPIAYWAGKGIISLFGRGSLSHHYDVKAGMCTGANADFIFGWHEVNFHQTNIASPSDYLYTAHNKGGEYRKWYGNRELVLKYSPKALKVMESNDGFRHDGKDYYFKKHIGWSKITSGSTSFRYFGEGFTFDSAGLGLFPKTNQNVYLTLAFLNSRVAEELIALLNPTLNVTPMVVKKLPFTDLKIEGKVEPIAQSNIELCKIDWDSYETSWDFKRHPLV